MASYFPKALLYREWREGRWIYALAALLTLLPGLLALVHYATLPTTGPFAASARANFWADFHRDAVMMANQNVGTVFLILAWVVVPAARVVPERSRGTLDTLLMAPVRRADWMRVKFWFGFAALTAGALFDFLLLWAVHVHAPAAQPTTTADVFREAGIHWVVYLSLYAMSFFISQCVTNSAGAAVVCLAISMAPVWLTTVLSRIAPGTVVQQVPVGSDTGFTMRPPAGTWGYELQWVSPVQMNLGDTGFTWHNPFLYGYLALAVVSYLGAMAYFRRMPAERFHHFLTHPSFWYWLLTGVSLVIGSVIGSVVAATQTDQPGQPIPAAGEQARYATAYLVGMLVSALIVWLGAFLAARARRGLRRQRRNLQATS